jgi:hypothetical protein
LWLTLTNYRNNTKEGREGESERGRGGEKEREIKVAK